MKFSLIKIHFLFFALISNSLTSCRGRSGDSLTHEDTQTPVRYTQTLLSLTPTSIPHTSTPVTPSSSPSSFSYEDPRTYQVEYIVTVYNQGFDIDELRVYQPNIIEWETQRDVQIEEISPPPTDVGVDPMYGNGILSWRIFGKPESGKSLEFKMKFRLTAYRTISTINPSEVKTYDITDPLYELYTQPERFIESSDSQIVDIADRVAGEETNPYLTARKFYDYVIDTSTYKLLGQGLLGAKHLVTSGLGECGDYSALFIALSRAKGIPARPVVGYWAISGVEQTHVWAEFYIEPFGWIPVDPTIGQSDPENRDYYFGNMDNQRVILNKGFNIPLDPPGPEDFVAPFLQVPLWWFWGSGGDASTVRLERTKWEVVSIQ